MSSDPPILPYQPRTDDIVRAFAVLPAVLSFVIPSVIPPYVYTHVPELAELYRSFGLRLSYRGQFLVDYAYWYGNGGWLLLAAAAVGVGLIYPRAMPYPPTPNPHRIAVVLLVALVLILLQILMAQRFLGTDAVGHILRSVVVKPT